MPMTNVSEDKYFFGKPSNPGAPSLVYGRLSRRFKTLSGHFPLVVKPKLPFTSKLMGQANGDDVGYGPPAVERHRP